MTMHELLEARVKALNVVNTECVEVYSVLAPFFADYVGKQVLKVDGTLLAKIKEKMPKLKNGGDLRVSWSPDEYTLQWRVYASVSFGFHGHSSHMDEVVTIGQLDGVVLKALSLPFVGRNDWTVAEVIEKRRAYDEVKKRLDGAISDLGPFGPNDWS